MTEPASGATSAAIFSLAGIAEAQLLGLPVATIFIATSFTFLGVLGRVGFEISKTADTEQGVRWGKVAALFSGGCLSSVTIAVIYLELLQAVNVKSDTALAIGLVFLGFSGAKALPWLLNSGASVINKGTGLKIPTIGQASSQDIPKP